MAPGSIRRWPDGVRQAGIFPDAAQRRKRRALTPVVVAKAVGVIHELVLGILVMTVTLALTVTIAEWKSLEFW